MILVFIAGSWHYICSTELGHPVARWLHRRAGNDTDHRTY